MITLDTSALIAILLGEASKPRLIELTKGQELIAPQSLQWELANAFSAKFKRNPQTLSLEEAKEALDIYKLIPIRFVDTDLARAVEMAYELGIYAYDAFMLATTERYQAPLLSLDIRCTALAKELKLPVLEVL
ncbi:type II toxin-antitoxin system VapC family toxin [soil metagenome]